MSRALVSMLLKGGCGYEDLRSLSSVVVDRWFDTVFSLIDEALRRSGKENYPPYNIGRIGEAQHQISLALAGFAHADVTITAEQNLLTLEVKGEKPDQQSSCQGHLVASLPVDLRSVDYPEAKGASFDNGLHKIDWWEKCLTQ